MILIKFSDNHNFEERGTAILITLVLLILLTGAAFNSLPYNNKTSVISAETTDTQSYEPMSRDECIDETSTTTNTTETETSTVTEEAEETSSDETESETDDEVYIQYYSKQDAIDIAKVLYAECRGVPSVTEQACVAWTILNRVDKTQSTVYSVVRAPHQYAFSERTKVDKELLDLAYDVLERWNREKNGETDVGRVLPKEYTFFEGKNGHNHFRDKYDGSYNIWDYSYESPYES